MAGNLRAGGLWRFRPRHYGSGHHDARDCRSGAGMSGASAVHINVFGLNPVVVFGTETQRKRMLPPMVEGKEKTCFNAVEDARGGPERPLHRQWTKGLSTARIAQKILLLARTTPLENVR